MKAIAYCRASLNDETSYLDTQETEIQEYCSSHGINIVKTIKEQADLSPMGKSPEIDKIIAGEADGDIDALVCTSTDRIASNVKQLLFMKMQLSEKGLEIICLDENSGESGAGKFAPMLGRA